MKLQHTIIHLWNIQYTVMKYTTYKYTIAYERFSFMNEYEIL